MEEAEDDDSSSQASLVKNLKKVLDKINRSNCDLFELLKLVQKLGLEFGNERSFFQQKYIFQKGRMEQIFNIIVGLNIQKLM